MRFISKPAMRLGLRLFYWYLIGYICSHITKTPIASKCKSETHVTDNVHVYNVYANMLHEEIHVVNCRGWKWLQNIFCGVSVSNEYIELCMWSMLKQATLMATSQSWVGTEYPQVLEYNCGVMYFCSALILRGFGLLFQIISCIISSI